MGDIARLVASEIAPARGQVGIDVTLYWLAARETGQNYKAFVHLLDASGQVVAQHDGDPAGGFTPTSRWQQGELIPDHHLLALPQDLPPGSYHLKAGLYQYEPFRNMLTDPPTADGRVDLGEIRLP
jgi:hypothetical protein